MKILQGQVTHINLRWTKKSFTSLVYFLKGEKGASWDYNLIVVIPPLYGSSVTLYVNPNNASDAAEFLTDAWNDYLESLKIR